MKILHLSDSNYYIHINKLLGFATLMCMSNFYYQKELDPKKTEIELIKDAEAIYILTQAPTGEKKELWEQ